MRRNVPILPALFVALAVVPASRAGAQNPPEQAKPNSSPAPAQGQVRNPPAPIDPQKLEELLKHWEKNSANLQRLDVKMTRTDRSPAWGEDDRYEGRAMFKVPNLAWLDFQKWKEVDDPATKAKKNQLVPHERIICTGTEVWQYRCDTAQIFIYPLEKDVQQRALEEGPLPFLFNFKAADAKKRYDMTLVAENADASLIRIVPRLPIDQDSFKLAFVTLDRQLFLLPRRILLMAPDGKSSKDFELHLDAKAANCDVADDNFHPKVVPGWKVVRNPAGDEKPGGGGARVAQPAPAPAPTPAGGADAPAARPRMGSRLFGGRQN